MIKKILHIIIFLVLIATSFNVYISNKNNVLSKPLSNKTFDYSIEWPDIISGQDSITIKKIPQVAILDTGIDFSNPLLIKSKYMDIDVSNSNDSDLTHGTNVAGIIAANGTEFKGLVPYCKLISIKLGEKGGWSTNKLAEGLRRAIELKPDVINISSGTYTDDKEVKELIKEAFQNNIVIVAAAGNDNKNDCTFPAAYSEVLSVGAIDRNLDITSNSNYGGNVKIFAPGEDILTTQPYNNSKLTTRVAGTSVAAAFISSLAAILKAEKPDLTADEINRIILKNSDYIGSKNVVNYNKTIKLNS